MIESINNEKVKNWTKLNEKKYQIIEESFLVEGAHLVEEAKSSNRLKEVIIQDGYDFPYEPKTFVNPSVMKKISSLKNPPKIIGVVELLESREIKGNVLLLDKISDPGNLGTIIRSAVAFKIDTIILGEDCVSIYNPKVIRATEGMIFHINIVERPLKEAITDIKEKGYKVYSTSVLNGESLDSVEFKEKTAVVMGSEGSGVSDEIAHLSDEFLYIPMEQSCESLNVGVATSIILYELHRKMSIK